MKQYREYSYVGSKELLAVLQKNSMRTHIASTADIQNWLKNSGQKLGLDRMVTATFIIDTQGELWIADRHSEHVLCAAGKNVLSAGEITFMVRPTTVEVTDITNQSTGYCPEPESWDAVEVALDQIGLTHPSDFTTAYQFRRCNNCETTNIIKDDWYECAVCQFPLSTLWNYDSIERKRISD
jgi:hypothetical protein